MSKVTVTFKMETADDESPDVSYLENTADNYRGLPADEIAKYVAQDAERLKAFQQGDWHMIGIRAVATICIERNGCHTNYTLKSPGLWGIESDSGETYLKSVFDEECATLRADIQAMKACTAPETPDPSTRTGPYTGDYDDLRGDRASETPDYTVEVPS